MFVSSLTTLSYCIKHPICEILSLKWHYDVVEKAADKIVIPKAMCDSILGCHYLKDDMKKDNKSYRSSIFQYNSNTF